MTIVDADLELHQREAEISNSTLVGMNQGHGWLRCQDYSSNGSASAVAAADKIRDCLLNEVIHT